jgi:glutamine amidotransferase
MKPRVTVVDYGLGNLHSVIKALAFVGATVDVAQAGADVEHAERLVLPGVGAFADGMAGLRGRGQVEALREFAASGRPFIGICLGAQLLMSESEEFGRHEGLGLIPGRVAMIPAGEAKVPHVGWGRLQCPPGRTWESTLLAGTAPDTWTYFVHSLHCVPTNMADVLATARHGRHELTAAVRRGNVTGFQFHPEKSGEQGLAILQSFVNFARE